MTVVGDCKVTYSENVHVNTIAKVNPVKAVREGSMIFRFERPTSRRVSCVFRDGNHRINIGKSPVSIL